VNTAAIAEGKPEIITHMARSYLQVIRAVRNPEIENMCPA